MWESVTRPASVSQFTMARREREACGGNLHHGLDGPAGEAAQLLHVQRVALVESAHVALHCVQVSLKNVHLYLQSHMVHAL